MAKDADGFRQVLADILTVKAIWAAALDARQIPVDELVVVDAHARIVDGRRDT